LETEFASRLETGTPGKGDDATQPERTDQPRGKFFHIDWPEPGRPQIEI